MATSQERYIIDPAQLQESDLDAAPRLRLALLQPLANPAMLAACRKHAPKRTVGYEHLGISALETAWRHALVKVAPAPHITFDLSLPKPVDVDSEAPHKIYWDTATPPTGQHMVILARNVMRLVASVATVTRMRVQGDVHFALSYDEAEGVSTRGMAILTEQLKDIAKAKGTVKTSTTGEDT